MKCLIVCSLLMLGCVLAQNLNDGRYYPELLNAKFDDGKWRPDRYSGSYRRGNPLQGSGKDASLAGRFVIAGIGSGASAVGAFGGSFGTGSTSGLNAARTAGSFSDTRTTKTNFGDSSTAPSIGVKEDTRQMNEDGTYYYRFLTDNNIEVSESGRVDNVGTDDEAMRVKGYYEYIGDDGVLYRVDYVADENGFQPTGDHLPTPPPIPEAILRSLQQRGLARK